MGVFPALLSEAWAQGRPDSLRMTCESARRLISERGALVLGTGPDLYDRYVATQSFCERDEFTYPAWIQTQNVRQCFIGYICKRYSDELER